MQITTPTDLTEDYACSRCTGITEHNVLAQVKTSDEIFDGEARILFWNGFLTIECKGCKTIHFCHTSSNSDNQDYDERGHMFPAEDRRTYPQSSTPATIEPPPFVDASRLSMIEALPKAPHDTTRLIQILHELNHSYAAHLYISCTYLIRAVLDHVPPIFGQASFAEVANNYAGNGKSFRDSMQHLQNSSRKIADAYLHSQIRQKEAIPNRTQVEFRADLDVLLAEIHRVLRPKA